MTDRSQELFALPTSCIELRTRAAELANSIADQAPVADESTSIDPIMRAALAESGLCQLMVPREFGGHFDSVNSLAVTVVREVLAGTSAHLDSLFAMQGIGSFAIATAGSTEIRRHWLPRVARCDAIAGLALTEPEIGSDLRSLTTSFVERDNEIVINGRKSFITNAVGADYFVVLGREAEGLSLVLVPANTPGLTATQPFDLIAPHVVGDLEFDDVVVPSDFRIGGLGEGFPLVLATLATFRVSVAGAAIGVAQAALREAVEHTRQRAQFNRPLIELGAVSQNLALSWTEIEMARSLTYRAASACVRDPLASLTLSSMAKVAATEMSGRVVDRAVQAMGRFGLVSGSKIERLYRESRPMRIYEGATEVILDSLGKQLAKGALGAQSDY
jgi:acyl-CoA dehydrogenase